MKRKAHILSIPRLTKLPAHVIFFDTETYEDITSPTTKVLRLRLGAATYCRCDDAGQLTRHTSITFTDARSFNDWLVAIACDRREVLVVAHNIGFDIRVVGTLKYLVEVGWERTALIDEGLNFIASFRLNRARIKFINNMQLFPISLKKLGESIGTYKAHVDFGTASDEQLLEYCKQDVEVMIVAWQKWIEFIVVNKLGSFKITAASQAMSAFRSRFMQPVIHIHVNEKAIELERRSYHGGRVECFFIGTYNAGKVYCLDINSMYPHVMREPVPIKLLHAHGHTSLAEFSRARRQFGYVADVSLTIHEPCLPVAGEKGRLCFPVGSVRGSFTKPELEYALQFGSLREVHALNLYLEGPVLKEYSEYFYAARKNFEKEGNVAFAFISKLLMNSLYGKFGQRQTEYRVIGTTKTIPDGIYKTAVDSSGRFVSLRVLGGIVEQETGRHEAYHAYPAIASYITARARIFLDTLIRRAHREQVLYCDTDSLFVTEAGFARLAQDIDNTELGKLKVVGVEDAMTLIAPKLYTFGAKSVRKGIRSNAIEVAPGVFEQDKFMSFRGSLRAGNLEGVTITRVRKRLAGHYTKGIVTPSGIVLPFQSPQYPIESQQSQPTSASQRQSLPLPL